MSQRATSNGTYVYGVTRAGKPLTASATGVDGVELRSVVFADVAALVSTLSSVPVRATRANLTAHTDVLQQAMDAGTVLPARFGFVMPNDAAVRERLLESRHGELVRALAEMEGRVEIGLKVYYLEEPILRDIVSENRQVAHLREAIQRLPGDAAYYQRIRLGELVVSAMAAKRVQDSAWVLERLEPLSVASDYDHEVPDRVVVKGAFLVERDGLPAFERALAKLAEEVSDRMHVKGVGPLPPYSFVSLSAPAQTPDFVSANAER